MYNTTMNLSVFCQVAFGKEPFATNNSILTIITLVSWVSVMLQSMIG